MKQQPPNQASGASETTRFFCTRISPAAGAAGELKQHRKEPNMANRNTNLGIGESVDSEGQTPRKLLFKAILFPFLELFPFSTPKTVSGCLLPEPLDGPPDCL